MWKRWSLLYFFAAAGMLLAALGTSRAVTVAVESIPVPREYRILLDPGHGGFDGGAISCTGVPESRYNLEISLRLKDLFSLLGYDTAMTRSTDTAINTEGQSISQRKISDLKQRARMINEVPKTVFLSIHQNTFSDGRYSGAQVFYGATNGSKLLAESMQDAFRSTINPGSSRQCKKSQGIYLMERAQCPALLIECGFLSNVQEEALLRDPDYQKGLCAVIAATTVRFIAEG